MTDHKHLAVDLLTNTWSLLDTTNRIPEQDEERVHSAHASRYHWVIAGIPSFANEGLVRALVKNDPERAKKCLHKAKNIGDGIENEEDRDWLHTNLDAISGELHDH